MEHKACDECGAVPAMPITVNAGEAEVTTWVCESCRTQLLQHTPVFEPRFECNG